MLAMGPLLPCSLLFFFSKISLLNVISNFSSSLFSENSDYFLKNVFFQNDYYYNPFFGLLQNTTLSREVSTPVSADVHVLAEIQRLRWISSLDRFCSERTKSRDASPGLV